MDIIQDYVCLDIETTGFGRNTEIIDVGAVKVSGGIIIDTFSELIKPTQSISHEITALTGISQSDVDNARGIEAVLSDFLDFIENYTLIGHNIASFDIPMIRRQTAIVLGKSFEPSYIDTLYLSKSIQGVPNYKLQTMLDHYGITNARAHRAFEDSEATNKLYLALISDGAVPQVKCSYQNTSNEEYKATLIKEQIENVIIADDILLSVEGLRLVLTGEFTSDKRDNIKTQLIANGAKVTAAVSSKTNYLIIGNRGSDMWRYGNGGGKVEQAVELGIKIITENSIMNILKSEEYNV